MANVWKCDICKADMFVNPPTEPIMDDPSPGGEARGPKPKMIKHRDMDFSTGKIKEVIIPAVKDLQLRAHILRFSAGRQTIQREVCSNCLTAHQATLNTFWEFLEKLAT